MQRRDQALQTLSTNKQQKENMNAKMKSRDCREKNEIGDRGYDRAQRKGIFKYFYPWIIPVHSTCKGLQLLAF